MTAVDFPENETFPSYEWRAVFEADSIDWRDVGQPTTPSERRCTIDDVAEVVAWEGSTNEPGGGTELSLCAVLRLTDGTYAAVDAWNDYTGWGCQDGVEVLFAPTLADLTAVGLTDEVRRALGFTTPEEHRTDDQ